MPFPDILPTLPELVRTSAQQHGSTDFVVTGSDRLTYEAAEARSRHVAAGLLANGVGKGSHVGLLMPNSPDWVVAFFAISRIGAVVVPINTFVQPRELAWTIHHADVSHLLCHPALLSNDYLARLEEALPDLTAQEGQQRLRLTAAPYLRSIWVWGHCDRAWSAGDEASLVDAGADLGDLVSEAESCVSPADPVVIVYTSGSTADPKGIVHTQGTVVRHSYNLTFSYLTTNGDVMFTSMPFFWIGGLITGLFAVIHHGATLITQPVFDPAEALELMELHRATIALGWPQQGKTLAEHPSHKDRDLSSIVRTSMPDFVPADRRAPEVSSLALGMTETCSCHTNFDPYTALDESKRGTFGPSVEGLEHTIIDPATGANLPPRTEGEILVRGYALMYGRYKVEREDLFDADGWYHTGDAGLLDEDGWLFFSGRLGDMIKTAGGTNVTPSEVEAALAGVPGVLEAYVTGIPDPDGTAGTQLIMAAVVPKGDASLDADQVRAAAKSQLSAFKLPKHIWVCAKTDLPFTDSGKIRKADLGPLIAKRFS